MNKANFKVNIEKCIGCGKCVKVCPGDIISINKLRKATISNFTEFGWNGCWQCEHCLAVCPVGAISIFGYLPENSLPVPKYEDTIPIINSLVANRHSCRRYKNKNVDSSIISDMLDCIANAPNGGNKQQVEFTIIDDKKQMGIFRQLVYFKMESLSLNGIYPKVFDKKSFEDMKR